MITATANLSSGISVTAQIVSVQTGSCAAATVHNSDSSYSTTVASGGDLPLPDNVITLKDTAANVLSTTNVPATNAADIEAADSTNEVNGVDILDPTLAGGTHNQLITDTLGNPVGTAANPSVISDNTINFNGADVDTVKAEESYAFLVKLDGINSGTYNAGTNTVSVVSAVCADATVHNSDSSYSTTVASGGDLPLPDNVITLKDTAANVLSTTNVPATNTADIEAPDGTVQIYNSVPTLLLAQGVASGGTESPTIGDSRVQNNATPTWQDTVEAEGTLTLAQAKALDSDGATTLLADYIPAADGFMFTCTPGSSASLVVGAYSDAGHTTPISTTPTNTTVYIQATPTGFTPDNYLFFTYDGTDLIKIGEQVSGDISWFPTLALTSGYVYAVASDSVSGVKAWSRVDFDVVGDPDADAFIAAATITDLTQKQAITTLVLQLKSDSIWTKFHAIYPFVGGTAFSHKFNLKNPLDTDAAYRLSFVGGGTHGVNGWLPNGTNAYANTFLTPSIDLSSANWHISYYSRTNIAAGTFDMGCGTATGSYSSSMFIRRSGDSIGYDSGNSTSGNRISSTETDSRGLYVGSIRSTSDRTFRKNGTTVVASNTSTLTNDLLDSPIILGAYNQRSFHSTGVSPSFYGSKESAFISIGDGLTNTDIANLYTAVQAFQTTLGRNV
jgi:hypothetical protein